jgi:hypothetical protein
MSNAMAHAQLFGPQQIISTSAYGAQSVASADLDGDGDLDVLSAAFSSNWNDQIAWYANNGSGGFGQGQTISVLVPAVQCVTTADLDGDGDLDVLSASTGDDKIAWYANDGSGVFGPQEIISTQLAGPTSIATGDLEGDGDLDVLCASVPDDNLVWYANDGSGSFGPQQFISTLTDQPRYVASADLDGDGDLDVLSASYGDDKIAWYENMTVVAAVPTVAAEQVALYPNPMTDELTVLLDQPGGAVVLEFFDMQGRSVRTETQAVQERRIMVPRNGLTPGLYLLRITGEKRSEAKLFVE